MRASLLLLSLLAGCAGSSDDDDDDKDEKDPEANPVELTIVSPEAGAEFAAEDTIPLKVQAKRGERTVEIESATWTIGVWTGEGKETEASGLQSGDKTAEVEAIVDGEAYTASVDFVILEPVETTWTYSGVLEADVTLATDDYGDFDDHCSAPITFTLDAGVITGGGQCMIFDDFVDDPMVFTMEGTVRGGTIEGNLVMSADGEDARTPFTGTGNAGEALSADFDNTFRGDGGTLRLVGSWQAAAQ